jgi:hypothetical protein
MSTDRSREELPEELKSIDSALRGLKPVSGAVDRDRLMYLAGRASVERSSRIERFAWPLATAALVVISVTLSGRLYVLSGRLEQVAQDQHTQAVEDRQIAGSSLPRESVALATPRVQTAGNSLDYMQLRSAVLSGGVDALPSSAVQSPAGRQSGAVPTLRDAILGS